MSTAIHIGVTLGVASAIVGQRCENSRATLPPNPFLLRFVSGLAAILAFVMLYSGFRIAWHIPFVALGLGLALFALYYRVLGFYIDPVLFSILTGLGCIGVAAGYYL